MSKIKQAEAEWLAHHFRQTVRAMNAMHRAGVGASVELSGEGRRKLWFQKIQTGTLTSIERPSAQYIGVRLSGRKTASSYWVGFWRVLKPKGRR